MNGGMYNTMLLQYAVRAIYKSLNKNIFLSGGNNRQQEHGGEGMGATIRGTTMP